MMELETRGGATALMGAAIFGHVDAMRVLLDHPSGNPVAMMMHTDCIMQVALVCAAESGHAGAMLVLLDHPSADSSAMMMHTDHKGEIALMTAAENGHVDAMRVLLDHPSADSAAMLAARNGIQGNDSARTLAALFAVGRRHLDGVEIPPSCAPLLFLLRRVRMNLEPRESQQALMTNVMDALFRKEVDECDEPVDLFSVDQPNNTRDECVRLLLEHGAAGYDPASPVMRRIISECVALARAPQLLNEAVMGVAIARQPR
ncbi:hypothetical protein FOA52_012392 [Chlamydomonas sp. UWO 241]|nr:hypothetical protein FOA52_012392 [Chlamydomonas sp. UWO 241]